MCEDFRDGRAFAEAARNAGKPVVLLTVGRTAAAVARRALPHRLSHERPRRRRRRVPRGRRPPGRHAARARRPGAGAALPTRPRGRRVAVVGDGGGYGAVAADLCGGHGLELPELSATTQAMLRSVLPPTAATANPVDLAGAGEQDTYSFARSTRALLEAAEVDAVLFTAYFGGYSEHVRRAAGPRARRRPAARRGLARDRPSTRRPHHVLGLAAGARAARRGDSRLPRDRVCSGCAGPPGRPRRAPRPLPELPPAASTPLPGDGYFAAREALAAAGVTFGEARLGRERDEAAAAAAAIGYPVVVKAVGRCTSRTPAASSPESATRRSSHGGVARLGSRELSVERMEDVAGGFELLIGARRDESFGPIVLVGAGGLYTETLSDTAVALAPVDEAEARSCCGRCAARRCSRRERPAGARSRCGGEGASGAVALRRRASGGGRSRGKPFAGAA